MAISTHCQKPRMNPGKIQPTQMLNSHERRQIKPKATRISAMTLLTTLSESSCVGDKVMNQEEGAKPLEANDRRQLRFRVPDNASFALSSVFHDGSNGAQEACGHPSRSSGLHIHDGLPNFPSVGHWRFREGSEGSRTKLFGFPSIVHCVNKLPAISLHR